MLAGRVRLAQGRAEEALARFDDALQIGTSLSMPGLIRQARSHRARALARLGRVEEAMAEVEAAPMPGRDGVLSEAEVLAARLAVQPDPILAERQASLLAALRAERHPFYRRAAERLSASGQPALPL